MARRKPNPPKPRVKDPRINRQIRANEVRVVVDDTEGSKGAQVMPLQEALNVAEERGLDLVEVSPGQEPPVCKIIDFGKYKFEQQKKKKEQSKNQHTIQLKEIKLRPKIGDHDYNIKKSRAQEFLEKGDKVKVSLRFRGREITHPELGKKLMERMVKDLVEVSNVETPAKMEGRQIIMVLSPRAGKKKKPDEAPAKKQVDGKAGSGDQGSSGSST